MSFFTPKQKSFIFKVAFLEAMALAIIMPTTFSTGELTPASISCPPKQFVTVIAVSSDTCGFAEAQLVETGNITMLMSAPAFVNTTIVTFPFPFPRTPNVTLSFALTEDSAAEYHIPTQQNFPNGTWSVMPNTITELFGSTFYRQWFAGGAGQLSCAAGAQGTCGVQTVELTGSVKVAGSANAKLRIQYNNSTLPNITTGWVDPCNGSADLSISTTGLLAAPICGGCSTCLVPWQADQIRIVGLGGNGIASPQISSLIVNIDNVVSRFSEVMICNNQSPIVCPTNGNFAQMPAGGVTSTQTAIEVFTFPVAPQKSVGALIYVIDWIASECILANLSAC